MWYDLYISEIGKDGEVNWIRFECDDSDGKNCKYLVNIWYYEWFVFSEEVSGYCKRLKV